jgi:pyrroline-5-carboxylate reductase
LAVKPQDFPGVLKEIKSGGYNKLMISIAAGISTSYIQKILGQTRIIRAMPNIGAKIGESVTAFCRGEYALEEDALFAEEMFNYFGTARMLPETMMDAACAISGSGPAYIFDFIESNSIDPLNIPEDLKKQIIRHLRTAAEEVGFSGETADFLAVNTTNCSLDLLKQSEESASMLRQRVTSRGGTTEAALAVLHKGGSWEQAALAALKRARELGM